MEARCTCSALTLAMISAFTEAAGSFARSDSMARIPDRDLQHTRMIKIPMNWQKLELVH